VLGTPNISVYFSEWRRLSQDNIEPAYTAHLNRYFAKSNQRKYLYVWLIRSQQILLQLRQADSCILFKSRDQLGLSFECWRSAYFSRRIFELQNVQAMRVHRQSCVWKLWQVWRGFVKLRLFQKHLEGIAS
jgi:hypothetical protein